MWIVPETDILLTLLVPSYFLASSVDRPGSLYRLLRGNVYVKLPYNRDLTSVDTSQTAGGERSDDQTVIFIASH